ncbi:MAG: NYN domain-containing protein [Terrimicrobiaceae bacterium]
MPVDPVKKTAIAFIDGQNLFRCAKTTFGHEHPNYDVQALASAVCSLKGWQLAETRFYTGVPDVSDDPFWNHFWTAKLAQMGRQKVRAYSRALRYRNQRFRLPDGTSQTVMVGQEKGIDVRIALDIVAAAYRQSADVLLVFSQDQDLSEVADEIRMIAEGQGRWLKIACAFPSSPTSLNRRGINGTDWIRIDRTLYDSCLDTRDYRPKKK